MARHEIDAHLGLPFLVPVDLGTAEQPICDYRYRAVIASEEAPHIIAKPSVPLPPAIPGEASDLVKSGCIPRFGDHLRSGQRGIRFDIPEHRWVKHRLAGRITRQNRSQIESET